MELWELPLIVVPLWGIFFTLNEILKEIKKK